VDEVQAALEKYAGQQLTPELLEIRIEADLEVENGELTVSALTDVERMAPFGKANEEPVFVAHGVTFNEIKPTRNANVVQLSLRQGQVWIKGVTFNLAKPLQEKTAGFEADVLFRAKVDEYNGNKRVQWIVRDIAERA
jgi:single-stranded-DNA-specific exonuclease